MTAAFSDQQFILLGRSTMENLHVGASAEVEDGGSVQPADSNRGNAVSKAQLAISVTTKAAEYHDAPVQPATFRTAFGYSGQS